VVELLLPFTDDRDNQAYEVAHMQFEFFRAMLNGRMEVVQRSFNSVANAHS